MMDRIRSVIRKYQQCGDAQRDEFLAARLAVEPQCAVTRYLAGCRAFDAKRPGIGVRHMMIARHAEPRFASAALLVFAGLNWIDRPSEPTLLVLYDTWVEFRKPAFGKHRKERLLLSLLVEKPIAHADDIPPEYARFATIPLKSIQRELALSAHATSDAEVRRYGVSPSG
ncbi:MAG: hypothetical protein AB7N71_14470 [Phycisphaerae bacterium]